MKVRVALRHEGKVKGAPPRELADQLERRAVRLLDRFGRGVRHAEVTVSEGGPAGEADRTGDRRRRAGGVKGARRTARKAARRATHSLRCVVRVALDTGREVVVTAAGATPAAAAAEALHRARHTVARRLADAHGHRAAA